MSKVSSQRNRYITVCEFQPIFAEQYLDGSYITKSDIQELRNYIDEQNKKDFFGQALMNEFLKPIKNGVQVNNYVGVIQTESGLTIEILPKIYGKTNQTQEKESIRTLFFQMLKTVKNLNGKTFKITNLNARQNNVLEVFISMFLSESDQIIKRGLKSTYVSIQNNEKYLKGKLLVTQHLRKNNINQTRFYNEFDEFLVDSPENQLLRTTLELLLTKSSDNNNLRIIREQLEYFALVNVTPSAEQTYQKIQIGRNYKYYAQAIEWCRLFLSGKSFTSFKGKSVSFAILFPMEKIFESYIAALTKSVLIDHQVSAQDRHYSLFDETSETKSRYNLRPDLVVRDSEKNIIIVDTKWKVLDSKGPLQADLYQMYAYYTRYKQKQENVDRVMLIYPYSENYLENEFRSLAVGCTDIVAKIQVKFVDLLSDSIETEIQKLFTTMV